MNSLKLIQMENIAKIGKRIYIKFNEHNNASTIR